MHDRGRALILAVLALLVLVAVSFAPSAPPLRHTQAPSFSQPHPEAARPVTTEPVPAARGKVATVHPERVEVSAGQTDLSPLTSLGHQWRLSEWQVRALRARGSLPADEELADEFRRHLDIAPLPPSWRTDGRGSR